MIAPAGCAARPVHQEGRHLPAFFVGARHSQGGAALCSAELELFRKAVGPDATVAREQHLLDGGQRCVYRITPS